MDTKLSQKIKEKLPLVNEYSFYNEEKNRIVGNELFPMPNIHLPVHLRHLKHDYRLNWGKKTINEYMSRLSFDYFKGDTKGYTFLMSKYYQNLMETIIKSTLISGVSFTWVLEDTFNSKTNSTVLFRDSGCCYVEFDKNQELDFALTELNDEDFLVYNKGNGYIFSPKTSDVTPLDVKLKVITFAIDREYGNPKIGKSIFTPNFFAILKNVSSLLSLYSQALVLEVNNKNILLAKGVEPQMLEDGSYQEPITEETTDSGIKTIYASPTSELNFETLEGITAENFNDLIKFLAQTAAAEVFLESSDFGFDSDVENESSLETRLEKIKQDLSSSFEELAFSIFSNFTGFDIKEKEESLTPMYKKEVSYEKIGAIGDALFKLKELGVNDESLQTFTDTFLGLSEREEKMKIKPKKREVN